MKSRILFTIGTAFLMGAMALVLTQTSCSSSEAESTTPAVPQAATIPQLKNRIDSLGSVDERMLVMEEYDKAVARLKANAQDADAWLMLADLFANEARITGDHPYYYPAALDVIEKALACSPLTDDQKFRALSSKGMVQMSLHRFEEALKTGEEAVKLNAHNAGIYGVLVDANVELGKYSGAVVMSDKMVSIRPDLRSYSRISYLREIHGDVQGAMDAMDMAVTAGYPGYEQTSWCRLMLGNLYESYGKLDEAKMHYQIALDQRPNYPFAMAALAGIQMKLKNFEEAEKLLDEAIALIPEVGFMEQLADLYEATGRTADAAKAKEEVLKMLQDDADHGHTVDLEFAKVYLHHFGNTEKALEYATRELNKRPDNIDVNKILSEIWLRKNQPSEAMKYMEKAMKTGSKDPELLAVAGLVYTANGQAEEGKKWMQYSLEGDPYQSFSVSGEVRNALK